MSNKRIDNLYKSITTLKDRGPEFMTREDAEKLARAFSALMTEYGFPDYWVAASGKGVFREAGSKCEPIEVDNNGHVIEKTRK